MADNASLKIGKSWSLPFQEIAILNKGMRTIERATLGEAKQSVEFSIEPGDYVVVGTGPNGVSTEQQVTLPAGGHKEVWLGQETSSPHEWLHDMAARGMLPESSVPVEVAQQVNLQTVAAETLRRISPLKSLSLPVPMPGMGISNVEVNLLALLELGAASRPSSHNKRQTELNLRTYRWSKKRKRWLRSELVEMADGNYAADFSHIVFPARQALDDDLGDSIHLLGVFAPGRAARFISVPLFADGTEIAISWKRDPVSEDGKREGATKPDSEPSARQKRITWRLAARNSELDGILQSLNWRNYSDPAVVTEVAADYAERTLREKRHDPQGAVVAALFLLQYRQLQQREDWVRNLAEWFPWSPDAQVLTAWCDLLSGTAGDAAIAAKLARLYETGPPQFNPAHKLARHLVGIAMENRATVAAYPEQTQENLSRLWTRMGRETRREILAGPFYAFERDYTTSRTG